MQPIQRPSLNSSCFLQWGPRNIHVAHVIVDGLIESDTALKFLGLPDNSRFPTGSVCA